MYTVEKRNEAVQIGLVWLLQKPKTDNWNCTVEINLLVTLFVHDQSHCTDVKNHSSFLH